MSREMDGVDLKYTDLQVITYAEHQLLMSEALRYMKSIPVMQKQFMADNQADAERRDPDTLVKACELTQHQLNVLQENHNGLVLVRCDEDSFFQVVTHCALILGLQIMIQKGQELLAYTMQMHERILNALERKQMFEEFDRLQGTDSTVRSGECNCPACLAEQSLNAVKH